MSPKNVRAAQNPKGEIPNKYAPVAFLVKWNGYNLDINRTAWLVFE